MRKMMKAMMKTMVILMATLFLFAGNVALPENTISGTITAEAASSSVKALAVGKSYTISGYAKVTSSKASVAKATKKSSSKYTVKALKKGTATLECYDSAGNLKKSIYLIVTNSSTISFDTSSVTLVAGKTKTVKATAQSGCTVKYSSSKKSVAAVSGSGKITAKKAGTATITASVYYKGKKVKSAAKTVKVVNYKYSTTAVTLTKGSSKTVKATVASGYKVKYSSSNSSVASVNSSGKITAKKAGTATISAKIYKGSTLKKTYKKKVTVKAAAASVNSGSGSSSTYSMSYTTSALIISPGKTASAGVFVSDGYTVTYASSDSTVASVSSSGVVTGKKGGTATITMKVYRNSTVVETFSRTVTVRAYSLSITSSSVVAGGSTKVKCTTADGQYNAKDSFVWSSSDTSVAALSGTGYSCTVKGVAAGTATITCKVNGVLTLTCNVTVKAKETEQQSETQKQTEQQSETQKQTEQQSETQKQTETEKQAETEKTLNVSWDTSPLTLSPGGTRSVQVKADVTSGYSTTYVSSDTSVVTVSSTGLLTGVSSGSATITLSVSCNGEVKKVLTKSVTVRSYTLSAASVSAAPGETVAMSSLLNCTADDGHTIYNDSAYALSTDVDYYSFSVKDTSIASVKSEDGKQYLVAKNCGTTTLTCKINYVLALTCQLTVKSDYSYDIYLLGTSEIYTKNTCWVYVKTADPDIKYLSLSSFGKTYSWDGSAPYDIEIWEKVGIGSGTFKVEGGYVFGVNSSNSGAITTALYAKYSVASSSSTYKITDSFTVNVIDTENARNSWIDWLISNLTTKDMEPFEKIESICAYLKSSDAGFRYPANDGCGVYSLIKESGPAFVSHVWDSCESPKYLEYIGERLNCFDDVHDCYSDYSYGTTEWYAYHAKCRFTIDDEVKYYSVCPASGTGYIESIDYIDFSSDEDLTPIEEAKADWTPDTDRMAEYLSATKAVSAVSVAGLEEDAAVAAAVSDAELEEMEIFLFTDEETDTSSTDAGDETVAVLERAEKGLDMTDNVEEADDVILTADDMNTENSESIVQAVEAPAGEENENEASMETIVVADE